jgi:hypothetical protein
MRAAAPTASAARPTVRVTYVDCGRVAEIPQAPLEAPRATPSTITPLLPLPRDHDRMPNQREPASTGEDPLSKHTPIVSPWRTRRGSSPRSTPRSNRSRQLPRSTRAISAASRLGSAVSA